MPFDIVSGEHLRQFGGSIPLLRCVVLMSLLIAAAEIDRRRGIIPNLLVGAGTVLGVLLLAGEGEAAGYVLASVVSAGLLLLVRTAGRLATGCFGMGMGDVKLAGMAGLYLGWSNLWALYLAVLLAGLVALVGLALGRLERTTLLPFAPFLASGAGLRLFCLPPELVFSL